MDSLVLLLLYSNLIDPDAQIGHRDSCCQNRFGSHIHNLALDTEGKEYDFYRPNEESKSLS